MDASKHGSPEEELAWLRNYQEEAERNLRPPEPEARAPLTSRQQEASAANEANATVRQQQDADAATANAAQARGLMARFRSEAAETPTAPNSPAAAPAPRPWWAPWRR